MEYSQYGANESMILPHISSLSFQLDSSKSRKLGNLAYLHFDDHLRVGLLDNISRSNRVECIGHTKSLKCLLQLHSNVLDALRCCCVCVESSSGCSKVAFDVHRVVIWTCEVDIGNCDSVLEGLVLIWTRWACWGISRFLLEYLEEAKSSRLRWGRGSWGSNWWWANLDGGCGLWNRYVVLERVLSVDPTIRVRLCVSFQP